MKELDVVMSGYLERHYDRASSADQVRFKALLELPDPELYGLLLGRSDNADPELEQILRVLRNVSA